MKHITKIIRVEKKTSKEGKEYYLTLAQLDDGSEVFGYGRGFRKDQRVEVFMNDTFDAIRFQKLKKKA